MKYDGVVLGAILFYRTGRGPLIVKYEYFKLIIFGLTVMNECRKKSATVLIEKWKLWITESNHECTWTTVIKTINLYISWSLFLIYLLTALFPVQKINQSYIYNSERGRSHIEVTILLMAHPYWGSLWSLCPVRQSPSLGVRLIFSDLCSGNTISDTYISVPWNSPVYHDLDVTVCILSAGIPTYTYSLPNRWNRWE